MELQNQTINNSIQLPTNTSGEGKKAIIPKEIKGWNWGAFLSTWIWGLFHNVWWSLLILLSQGINYIIWTTPLRGWYGSFFLSGFLSLIGFIMTIVLGIKGNEWAWRARHYSSIKEFKKRERIWVYIAIPILLGLWFSGWLVIQIQQLLIILMGLAWIGAGG